MNGIIEEMKEKNEKNNVEYEIGRYAQALEERETELENLTG